MLFGIIKVRTFICPSCKDPALGSLIGTVIGHLNVKLTIISKMFKSCIAYFTQTIFQINSISSIVIHLCILHLGRNRQFNILVQVPTCLGAHSLM